MVQIKKEISDKVSWAVDIVGLREFRKKYPHQLSGGMKQRVAIARALVMNSKVLLINEPFGALDAFTKMNLQDDLMKLWEKHKFTTVFVTYNIDEAIYLSDRIVVMTSSPGSGQNYNKMLICLDREYEPVMILLI